MLYNHAVLSTTIRTQIYLTDGQRELIDRSPRPKE